MFGGTLVEDAVTVEEHSRAPQAVASSTLGSSVFVPDTADDIEAGRATVLASGGEGVNADGRADSLSDAVQPVLSLASDDR